METSADLVNKRKIFEDMLIREIETLKVMAGHFVCEKDEREDLVQDTIVKALRFADKFDIHTDIRKWLYTIMRNTFINQVNRTARKREHEARLEKAARNIFAVNSAFSKFLLEDVNVVIGKLSVPIRKAIELYNAGYKYREIALTTSQPIGTVKTRVRAARMALAKKLNLVPLHSKL